MPPVVVKSVRPMPLALRIARLLPALDTAILVPSGENDGSVSFVALLGRQVGAALLAVADTTPIGVAVPQWFVSLRAILVPSGDHETWSSVKPMLATTTLGRPPPMGMVSRFSPAAAQVLS